MAKKQKAKRTKKYSSKRTRAVSKRKDYRKGGRVSLVHGGRPRLADFKEMGNMADARELYQMALAAWEADPAHTADQDDGGNDNGGNDNGGNDNGGNDNGGGNNTPVCLLYTSPSPRDRG